MFRQIMVGLCCVVGSVVCAQSLPRQPNQIFILADDLGYGDLACYGQQIIRTPRIDQMAAEGMRFTDFYAGNTVCAPSRSVLMTGLHMGHTHVRGNAGGNMLVQTLRKEDKTVAEVLQQAGYRTGLVGKWGLGEMETPGHPLEKGFDSFFGYLNQTHAHNYYPEFLWRGLEKQKLANEVTTLPGKSGGFSGGQATKRVDYSHDLFAEEALKFIGEHANEPFFLYLALTTPHANNEGTRLTGNGAEVPDFGIYADRNWPDADKGQAAMITRMDRDVGRVLDLLKQLKLEERTLVFFTSDNGPHNESNHDVKRFRPAGPLQGIKRSLHEGGIRVPAIAWWPSVVPAGVTSDTVAYFGDWMATAAELAGTTPPANDDSISLVPTLTGRQAEQVKHKYLYWEFYEQGSRQAVRFNRWKAIREPMLTGTVQLFDLQSDLAEQHDLAAENADLVAQAVAYMDEAHHPHPNWEVPTPKAKVSK
jgi:arylsulfatase A-like enzyme